jgi:hypothetical protein
LGHFASPFRFLNDVRGRIYGRYAPDIGEAVNDDIRRFGIIKAGLFFSDSSTADAARLKTKDASALHVAAFGWDALDPDNPEVVVPILGRAAVLQEGWFEILDRAFTHDRRIPDPLAAILLTPEQRRHAAPSPGYTGIEGVVGSGKTIVLAYRAALGAESGRLMLILTFNRTLTNYVLGTLGLVPVVYRSDRVTVLHFHDLCRKIHEHYRQPLPPVRRAIPEGDEPSDDDGEVDEGALEVGWPASAMRLIQERGVPPGLRFDGVLVDEAQDFSPIWFELIQRLSASEVVIAYDSAQRLYERDEAMSRGEVARLFGGRTGRLRTLGKAIRLPLRSVRMASTFAQRWSLKTAALEADVDGLLPPDAPLSTLSVGSPAEAASGIIGLVLTWQSEPGYRSRDVAIVVPSNSIGETLVRLLAEHGVSTNHVFAVRHTGALMETQIAGDKDPVWLIEQAHKQAFKYGDARLKVSSVHSFKGWEAGRVILMLPFQRPSRRTAALVYVGLTRSRGTLALVGLIEEYGLDHIEGALSDIAKGDHQVAARFDVLFAEAEAVRARHRKPRTRRAEASHGVTDPRSPDWPSWVPEEA